MIGAKPNLWSLFMEDPKLAFRCFFGSCVSAQYRLEGPNSSKHARTMIRIIFSPWRQENAIHPQLKEETIIFLFFYSWVLCLWFLLCLDNNSKLNFLIVSNLTSLCCTTYIYIGCKMGLIKAIKGHYFKVIKLI